MQADQWKRFGPQPHDSLIIKEGEHKHYRLLSLEWNPIWILTEYECGQFFFVSLLQSSKY